MIQLDNNSTCEGLIHACFDRMTSAQTASGHLARTLAPHICCSDAVADRPTNLSGHPKICTTRPQAVTPRGQNACNAHIEHRCQEGRSCAPEEDKEK